MFENNRPANYQRALLLVACALVVMATSSCKKKGPNFSFQAPVGDGPGMLWQEPDEKSGEPERLLWYAHYIGDSKIGHRRFTVRELKVGEETLRRISGDDHLETLRFSKRNDQDLTQVSIEKADGGIHSFGYKITSGETRSVVAGTVVGSQVDVVRQEADEQEQTFTMGWPKNGPSIFAVEQSLWQKPMIAGEEREVLVYRPLQGVMTKLRLAAKKLESVEISGESQELLRIESQNASQEDLSGVSNHWMDANGTIVKTEYPFMNRTLVLVSEEKAKSPNEPYSVDLGFGNVIKTEADFDSDPPPTRAVYKVSLQSLSPDRLFAQGLSQQIGSVSGNTALIRVKTVSPEVPATLQKLQERPTTDDRVANALVDCDDLRVNAFAEAVTSRDRDPWKTAVALENAVYAQLDKKETSQVFDSAGVVLDKRSGDCSEHAVLLAAACRNYGIPARVVVGLIYDQPRGGFLYHMWNEVWIHDRWIPLDATIGKGRVGVDHIKFHHSSLAGQSPYNVVTPIINVMGQLKIELMGLKYD